MFSKTDHKSSISPRTARRLRRGRENASTVQRLLAEERANRRPPEAAPAPIRDGRPPQADRPRF